MAARTKKGRSIPSPVFTPPAVAAIRRKPGATLEPVRPAEPTDMKGLPQKREPSVSMTGGIPSEPMRQAYREGTTVIVTPQAASAPAS